MAEDGIPAVAASQVLILRSPGQGRICDDGGIRNPATITLMQAFPMSRGA